MLFSAVFGAALVGVLHANSIGLSGPGFGLEAMALTGRRALRAYFSGQNIALGLIAVPLLTVISFGLAALAKHPVDGFLGMAVALAGIGAALGLGDIFSVTLPYPMEKRAGSPMPRPADGFTGDRLGGTFGSLVGTAVAAIPVVLGVVFTRSDPATVRMPVLVAVRCRLRPRAGLDRRAHGRPRGRAAAARALPDRRPQQALADRGTAGSEL